jgi:hypothetical protein
MYIIGKFKMPQLVQVTSFNGSQFDSVANYPFNTPGSFNFILTFETNCCGGSLSDTIKNFC